MAFKRWYDKDIILQKIVSLLENLDEETQNDIANDIIQLIIDKQYDSDEFIRIINAKTLPAENRWYDKNETVQAAVEMLKDTDEYERKELFNELLISFFNFSNEEVLKFIGTEDNRT